MYSDSLSPVQLIVVALCLAGCTVLPDDAGPTAATRGEPVSISAPSEPSRYTRPDWVTNAVLYEVSVRDFTEKGTFRAVIPHLPRLKEMGVTTLWLMPFHPIGEERRLGEWGSPYSVRDFYDVNPEYGSKEDFRALVEAVHEEGMHLILDLVANHTAWDHPWIEAHPEWYQRDDTGEITHPPGTDWTDVAALDYDEPEVHRAMKEVMRYWVEEFDVDGYRCDAAARVPADFWEAAIEELRSVDPVMMLAEADRPALHDRGFDLSYSWDLYRVLKVVWNGAPTSRAVSTLLEEQNRLPDHALPLRFTTNHDKVASDGSPLSVFDALDGAQAAALVTATVVGTPLVYNGQEVGSARPPFRGESIDWDAGPEMTALYTHLLQDLRQRPALRRGDLTLHHPDGDDVLVLERTAEPERVLVVVNVRDEVVHGPLPSSWQEREVYDLFRERTHETGRSVSLPAYGFRVFQTKEVAKHHADPASQGDAQDAEARAGTSNASQ